MKIPGRTLAGVAMAAWVSLACWAAPGRLEAASTGTTAGTPPDATSLSTNVIELVRLAESGVEEDVILAYIDTCQGPFELSADDIIYLKDLGISAEIITAMLHRDAVLREQAVRPGTTPTPPPVEVPKVPPPATNVPNAPEPVYVTNAPTQVVYFYDSLAPYGTWIDLEGQGWGWQPRVMVVDPYWQPYWHGGRWLYTDCGWYWHSDYSWGWAPFHYGRWHHHQRHGWVWFPGLTWAPAWVSWRYSDRYCGWAPLPPGARFAAGQGWRFNNVSVGVNFDFNLGADLYHFVEIGHLQDPRPHLHAIPPAHTVEIRNQTTVINNYVLGPNNRIINQGVAADRVAAASGREIRPVTVKEVSVPSEVARRDRIARDGNATVLYRPELKAPAKPAPAVAQKVDERRPIVRPTPQRPSVSVRPGGLAPVARPAAPPTVAPAKTPAPGGIEGRPVTTVPVTPKGTAGRPSEPKVVTIQPVPPSPRTTPSVQPAVPRRPGSIPQKIETPKGREQRLSNGTRMQRPALPPATSPSTQPPSTRPPVQKGTDTKPPSFSGVKPLAVPPSAR